MNVEKAIVSILRANAPVAAAFAARIFPVVLPQDQAEYPAAVYQRIDGRPDYTHSGPSGLEAPRIQIRAWARDYKVAKDGARLISDALSGFVGDVTVGSEVFRISPILVEDSADIYDESMEIFGSTIDAIVWHGSGS